MAFVPNESRFVVTVSDVFHGYLQTSLFVGKFVTMHSRKPIKVFPTTYHEGNTMRKIMGNKPQVSSAIINHSPLQISWNDLLHQGQTADVSIIRAKTGTFSIETLDVHLAP
jgi:hypothetical protein